MTASPEPPVVPDEAVRAVQAEVDNHWHSAVLDACCCGEPDGPADWHREKVALAAAAPAIVAANPPEPADDLSWAEMLTHQSCPTEKHPDWFIDSEYNHPCPWCRIEDLDAQVAAARKDERTKVVALPVAMAEAFVVHRLCKTCTGFSPPWDGHDMHPPCVGAAREHVRAQIEALTESPSGHGTPEERHG